MVSSRTNLPFILDSMSDTLPLMCHMTPPTGIMSASSASCIHWNVVMIECLSACNDPEAFESLLYPLRPHLSSLHDAARLRYGYLWRDGRDFIGAVSFSPVSLDHRGQWYYQSPSHFAYFSVLVLRRRLPLSVCFRSLYRAIPWGDFRFPLLLLANPVTPEGQRVVSYLGGSPHPLDTSLSCVVVPRFSRLPFMRQPSQRPRQTAAPSL